MSLSNTYLLDNNECRVYASGVDIIDPNGKHTFLHLGEVALILKAYSEHEYRELINSYVRRIHMKE